MLVNLLFVILIRRQCNGQVRRWNSLRSFWNHNPRCEYLSIYNFVPLTFLNVQKQRPLVNLVTLLSLVYPQIYNTVEKIRANGGVVVREPGPFTKDGTTIFAFVKDPNGYGFELLQRPPTPEPLCQMCINVFDIDRSIEFYNKVCLLSYQKPLLLFIIIYCKFS